MHQYIKTQTEFHKNISMGRNTDSTQRLAYLLRTFLQCHKLTGLNMTVETLGKRQKGGKRLPRQQWKTSATYKMLLLLHVQNVHFHLIVISLNSVTRNVLVPGDESTTHSFSADQADWCFCWFKMKGQWLWNKKLVILL